MFLNLAIVMRYTYIHMSHDFDLSKHVYGGCVAERKVSFCPPQRDRPLVDLLICCLLGDVRERMMDRVERSLFFSNLLLFFFPLHLWFFDGSTRFRLTLFFRKEKKPKQTRANIKYNVSVGSIQPDIPHQKRGNGVKRLGDHLLNT